MPDYSDLDPNRLKPGLTDGSGNLKPSLVTPDYTGGTPDSASEVKPSLIRPDGSLRPGLLLAGDLKPSLLAVVGGVDSQTIQLGKTTPGDQVATSLSSNYVWASGAYLAEFSGEIQSISLYTSQATGEATLGVWLDSAGTIGELVAVSEAGAPLANDWLTLSASGSIVAGQSYWVGWNFFTNRNVGYDTAVNGTTKFKASAYSSGALEDPFPGSPSVVGRRYPAYLTYQT
ncbi:hypothetical protein [Aureliella helgolandensis]|uniref:Uncharacterized protein n=1 Tax=Aureliella helgolandensis TaxID=2527968 RepID=A0A518GE98_9BACT|nr:hypothetical protein [Aureliella helgolandensis]QDV26919.1 hypothetical protein Q31a_52990 [Aureliella helgolandensis]